MKAQGLQAITFFNSERFPYSHVEVNGNTMFCGTNGSGKTTTMRAMLSFYGAEKLGISRDEKKWTQYAYPFENSFICYSYEGELETILLITHRVHNHINYRFLPIQSNDLEELLQEHFLNGSEVRTPKEVFSSLKAIGLNLSESVTGAEKYKKIIYGDTGRELKDYRKYALLKSGKDYKQIPSVLSSVFLNSSLESSDIDKVVAGSINSYAQIDLPQLRNHIAKILDQRNTIENFENTARLQKEVIAAHDKYHDLQKKAIFHLRQVYAFYFNAKKELPDLRALSTKLDIYLKDLIVENNAKKELASELVKSTYNVKATLTIKHTAAKDLEHRYSDKSILLKQKEVEGLSSYRSKLTSEKDLLDALVGSLDEIRLGFEKRIIKIKQDADEEINDKRESLEDENELRSKEIEDANIDLESKITEIANNSSNEQELLKSKDIELTRKEKDLQVKVEILDRSNPYLVGDDIVALDKSVKKSSSELENLERMKISIKDGLKIKLDRRDDLISMIDRISVDATTLFEGRAQPIRIEVNEQKKLLSFDKNSLLGFLRENKHPKEELIASLLKEKDVLLNTQLNPRISENTDSIFGLTIDEEMLEKSLYSADEINIKINTLNKKIHDIKSEVSDKAEENIKHANKNLKQLVAEISADNMKIDELGQKGLTLTARIHSLEEDYAQALELSSTQYQDEKNKLNEELADVNKQALLSSNAVSNFYAVIEAKKELLRQATKTLVSSLITRNKENVTKFKERKNKILINVQSYKEKIEVEMNTVLESKGVNTKQTKELEGKILKLNASIKKAEGYTKDVTQYERDLETIVKIPDIGRELLEATAKHNEASLNKELLEKQVLKDEGEGRNTLEGTLDKIKTHEGTIRDFKDNHKDPSSQDLEIKGYDSSLIINDNTKRTENLTYHHTYFGATETHMGKEVNIIQSKMNTIFSKISHAEDLFGIKKREGSTKEILLMAEDIKELISSGRIIEIKGIVAVGFQNEFSSLVGTFEEIIKEGDEVKTLISKLRANLRTSIDSIAVLDKLDIRYSPTYSEILAELKNMNEIELPIGDSASLFWDGNSEQYVKAYTAFEKFADLLSESKAKKITVMDTFNTEYLFSQNGQESTWVKSRTTMGSTGTTIIAKTLVYIALLDAVLKKADKERNILVHVLLDEIGTLSQVNMKAIVGFANTLNINFTNAAPDSKAHKLYERTYHYKVDAKTKKSYASTIEMKKPIRKVS